MKSIMDLLTPWYAVIGTFGTLMQCFIAHGMDKPWQAPFFFIMYAWEEARKKFNTAGCIIVTTVIAIFTLPATVGTAACLIAFFIVLWLPYKLLLLLFGKKEKA